MARWWLIAAIVFWLWSIYTAAVSINCLRYLSRMLCILSLCILYDWITIMEYNKNELSSAINMLYSLPPHNGHFLLSPRWPLWRGSTVLCNLVECFYCRIFLAFYRWYVEHLTMQICIDLCKMMFFLVRMWLWAFLLFYFFSVDSSTCSAEDGQQGSSNVWSTYCERSQVGGIWTFQSSCAPVPASYLIALTSSP